MQNFKHAVRSTVLSTALAALGLGIASVSAQAQTLNGSLPLGGITVNQNAGDLLTSTTLTDAFAITTGPGLGDYAPIPLGAVYATTTLTLASPTDFTITNPIWGSFLASSFVIVSHTSTNYDVELFGNYTPGTGLPGFVTTNGELRISVNQSGQSLSEAITLSTPAFDVPEPGTVAMLMGMGVSGSAFLIRRRRRA